MTNEKTTEELREMCNEASPQEAFVTLLSYMQRIAVALEALATPTTLLFEQAPTNDGLGNLDPSPRADESEH